jgi:hypothetical protein
MMILTIKVVLAALAAYLLALATRRWEHRVTIVAVLSAVCAVLLAAVTDQAETWLDDPRPLISVQPTETEILLGWRTHSPTSHMAIEFPVLGRIVNVHDYNSPADARTVSKAIVGLNMPKSQNNVEIVLADITPNRPLSFKILYEPMREKVEIAGTDRWQMLYSWLHGGATITTTKWYLTANGEEVGPPSINVKGVVIIPRALSPDEVKKLYEQGPPRTLIR